MALGLASASSQYCSRSNALTGATAKTISLWFKPSSVHDGALWGMNGQTLQSFLNLYWRGSGGAGALRLEVSDAVSGGDTQDTANASSSGSWAHAVSVSSGSSHNAYLNGGAATTTITRSPNWVTPNTPYVALGCTHVSATFFNGSVCEVGIWSVALGAGELAALAKGFCPLLIRPASLVAYYPCSRSDRSGGSLLDRFRDRYDLAESNSPTTTDHAPIFAPSGMARRSGRR